jgi:thymidylate synthase (FAD)
MIEHASASVKFIRDRGVSHELVRHRMASWAQESTRYCNYGKANEVTVIEPCFWPGTERMMAEGKAYEEHRPSQYMLWYETCEIAEKAYLKLLELGSSPQEARSVLPNSLKTEIVMTANMREWRHFFKLRCAPSAHPQMRELTIPLFQEFHSRIPVLFDDIYEAPFLRNKD